jgi:hypothetical protein
MVVGTPLSSKFIFFSGFGPDGMASKSLISAPLDACDTVARGKCGQSKNCRCDDAEEKRLPFH